MSALRRNIGTGFCVLFALALIALAFTQIVNAQTNVGATTDAMCRSLCATAAANNKPCPAPTHITCQTLTVTGICQIVGCQATAAGGLNGGNSLSSMSQLLGQVGQLLGKLMQGSGSGSGSTPTTGTTCTSYTPTSDQTQIGVNPCVYYVPSTTCSDATASNYGAAGVCTYSGSSTLNNLLGEIGGGTGTVTSATLSASPQSGASPLAVTFTTSAVDDTQAYSVDPGDGGSSVSLSSGGCASGSCPFSGTYTYETAGTYTATLSGEFGDSLGSATVSVENPGGPSGQSTGLTQVLSGLLSGTSSVQGLGQTSSNFPGVLGNILLDQNGATIFASTINSSNNSETSGFYGSNTLGSQPQGVAAQLCESTPWASNFLADIIPPSFFNSLCQWGGFQVGQPAATASGPQVTLTQTQSPASKPAATSTAATTSSVPAQAQITAEPSAVPLGARTSIFWNTQGVTSCTETSPDGSFSENSLSGAAATVPITGPTTFTIYCLDPNGNPVTDYVTVELSS